MCMEPEKSPQLFRGRLIPCAEQIQSHIYPLTFFNQLYCAEETRRPTKLKYGHRKTYLDSIQ